MGDEESCHLIIKTFISKDFIIGPLEKSVSQGDGVRNYAITEVSHMCTYARKSCIVS